MHLRDGLLKGDHLLAETDEHLQLALDLLGRGLQASDLDVVFTQLGT
jgi:hypothetical protein